MQAVTEKVMHKAARAASLPRPHVDILASVPEFEDIQTTMQASWPDVQLALRTRNYKLWNLPATSSSGRKCSSLFNTLTTKEEKWQERYW